MEDIFTDPQVPRHPLRHILKIILLALFTIEFSIAFSQSYSTQDKKAIKFYEEAQSLVKSRRFNEAIEAYQTAIKKDPLFQEPYLRLAYIFNLYQKKDSALLYYEGYTNVTPKDQISPAIWRTLAFMNFSHGRYDKAQSQLEYYLTVAPGMEKDPDIIRLLQSIEFSKESIRTHKPKEITPLPRNVNKWMLQYFPVLTGDSRTLIFTKRDSNSAYSDEDLVYSFLSDSGWTEAKSISRTINSKLNEGAATISADGRTLIFTSCDGRQSFGSCDLYISKKIGDFWGTPENMGSTINSSSWDSQPSLSADGRTLYFSSNRPGGYGMRDIWVSKYNGLIWSRPQNLGRTINSKQDETTPVHSCK